MTNNARQRNNLERRTRPKSWCAPSSRVDPAMTRNVIGSSKQLLWYGDRYAEEKDANNPKRDFSYRKCGASSTHGSMANGLRRDDNNNFSSDNIRYTAGGKHPKVIRRTNVDKASRRAVVSLNLSKDYSSSVDQVTTIHTKKSRPKSLYHNFFRRSCSLLKSHVFGDNSKHDNLGSSCKSTKRSLDVFRESREIPSENVLEDYGSILTDGETCIFSNVHAPFDGEGTAQLQWNRWGSNDDIFQGVSLETAESLHGTVGDINHTEARLGNLMPWTKRTNSMPEHEVPPVEPFQCRRDHRKYSSLRSPTKSKGGTPPKPSPCESERSNINEEQFSLLKRHSNENIRFNRGGSARYHRPHSMDNSAFRRKTINFTTPDRFIDDSMKSFNQKTMKNKKGNAPNFFIRYQDVLREEKITATPPPIPYYDSSKFTQINEVFEYLLNLHCTKPVTKTCKQLFYIRSRLSKNARRNDSMCDGCFGCGKENATLKTRL